jgi:glycosyltransferase involved in cell wall biosynthesis
MLIHMMTPVLTTGDAIGNYMISLQRVFQLLGVNVRLYADYIDPAYRHSARPTSAYRPTGREILWFHYSIWADNFAVLDRSNDFKVMDYHGVTPPHLFADFDPRLAALCDKAIKALPTYVDVFDWCIYHAENGRWDLEQAGYTRFSKVRLPVDTAFFGLQEDPELASMLQSLEYMMFVGRIVPQKDVLSIVRVFAEVHRYRPNAVLFLIGSTDILPGYVRQVQEEIRRLGIEHRVQMTGKISDRAALTTFYRHAKFLISLSEWESYCVPSGEAMFFGLPVIHHGAAPMPENVGDAGVMIDKCDPAAAGKIIADVWSDPERYVQLQANALRRAHWFTDAALAEALRGVLRDWAIAFADKAVPIAPRDHSPSRANLG